MPGRWLEDVYRGRQKFWAVKGGPLKILAKSQKGGHENYIANMSYLKQKRLLSMIFVKPCISNHCIINEYFHESLGIFFFSWKNFHVLLGYLLSENIICSLEICHPIWYKRGSRKITAKRPAGVLKNFSGEMEGLWKIFIINRNIFWPPTRY